MAEQLTYDPVVDARSQGGPWEPPPRGRALVLVPGEGVLVTVRAGERVPPGAWQGVFTVDVSEHRLVMPVRLSGLSVRVILRCRVADPALVVALGVRDVGSVLYGEVRALVTAAATSAAGAYAAQGAVDRALQGLTGDAAVRVRDARAVVEGAAGTVLRGEVVAREGGEAGSSGDAGSPRGAVDAEVGQAAAQVSRVRGVRRGDRPERGR
jgi:hypothetical protein